MARMKEALAHVPMVDKGPWVTGFGEDASTWNIHQDDDEHDGEGSGLPGRSLIARALRTFGDCWGGFDPETAARIFNLPLALVEETGVAADRVWEADPADVELNELGKAVQVLTACRSNWGTADVATVAMLLNQHPVRIVEAVTSHYWMFLSGDRDNFEQLFIEHEGE